MAYLKCKVWCQFIKFQESPIAPAAAPAPRPSVTKSVKWRYLGNQAWYHRSADVKTTRKRFLKNSKKDFKTKSEKNSEKIFGFFLQKSETIFEEKNSKNNNFRKNVKRKFLKKSGQKSNQISKKTSENNSERKL